MAKHGPNDACPCHSGLKYKRCCGPLHGGGARAPTPEALMRSRYAAYALGLVDYVLATTDPEGPQAGPDRRAWAADVEGFIARTRFVGLEILGSGSGSDGDAGWVEFRASLMQGGRDASFVEKSAFVRRAGCWLYHSATEHSGRK
jgi:SEC-C motif domain protein